ncbi:MAG TPA: ABC transporter permease [Thiotrichales bacterium]|nr:ABC transporter permease [Thiotrichales bacterium]
MMFKAVWQYRYFVLSSIKNDFKARFVRSKIGGLWLVLHPLAMVLIYALILSTLLKAKLPDVDTIYAYPIYLTAGILAWTIFSESVSRSLTIFVDNGNLIKKVAFPKLVLPIITFGTVALNSLVLLVAIFIVFAFLGHFPGVQALWLPVLFGVTLVFGMSIGLILGVLNVFIRDIGQIVPVILQFGFWLTPIVYTITIIPEAHQHWFDYNPMTHIAMAFQDVLLYNRMIDVFALVKFFGASLLLLALGLFMFKKAAPEMVDQL